MTEHEKKKARRGNHARRIAYLQKDIGIEPWSERETRRLLTRLDNVAGDGVTDPDLRVIVRLYNRELVGRRRKRSDAA